MRAAQEASPTVRLVGGTGLALLLGHRRSEDIDIFCAPREDIGPVVAAVEAAAAEAGVRATPVRSGPFYKRLEIDRADGLVRVDVAADSALRLEPEPTMLGALRVETLRDQRANKLVALLGRSELRDLVDLYFIEQAGLPAINGLGDAVTKDGGMDPAWFAWALGQVKVAALPGMLVPLDLEDLARYRDRLQAGLLHIAAGG